MTKSTVQLNPDDFSGCHLIAFLARVQHTGRGCVLDTPVANLLIDKRGRPHSHCFELSVSCNLKSSVKNKARLI